MKHGAFGRGGTMDTALFVGVAKAYSAEPVIRRINARIRKRVRWTEGHLRRYFCWARRDGGGCGRVGYWRSGGGRQIPRVARVYVVVADVARGTLAARPSRTVILELPALVPSVVHPHPAPVVIRVVVAPSRVRRPLRSPRALLGGLAGHEPVAVPEPSVAVGVREAFEAELLVPLALLRLAGGAVLTGPAVGIVPLVTAEEAVLGPVGPNGRFDEEGGGRPEQRGA
mmetsp:Transcript_47574/g.101089  ORF Transcript_47574/g.101089 Transcript_47574/m.101089 type:complete len:227 (-) Transcript_47574:297-977(-)